MNIGEVAERSGIPTKTIRYYEDIGFLHPKRNDNGYRVFEDNELHKLIFIGRARSLGFNIEECRALLALYDDKERGSADVKQIAKEHVKEIERKITDLMAMRDTLTHLIEACAGDHRPDCPIIDNLSDAKMN